MNVEIRVSGLCSKVDLVAFRLPLCHWIELSVHTVDSERPIFYLNATPTSGYSTVQHLLGLHESACIRPFYKVYIPDDVAGHVLRPV